MIKKVDIQKSFYMLGCSMDKCYDCKYCRAKSTQVDKVDYSVLPSDVNINLINVPIAINLYYGDPFLQVDKTYDYLIKLKVSNHKGPVIIITKGSIRDITWLKDDTFIDLDLHIAFSTFGLYSKYDKHSHKQFLENLDTKINYKRSIEFRPICNGINDDYETIKGVFLTAKKYDVPIGYSGLQGKPDIVEWWQKEGYDFKPYPGYHFGHKKSISDDVQDIFDQFSHSYNIPIFRKTSCLISYVHNLDRDYNAHYYRPTEMCCNNCVMKDKCFDFKSKLTLDKSKIEHLVPFDFDIIYKEHHECILKTKKICEFTTKDCSNINGNIIKINKKITTADVRVIKWLTGYTVDADFYESQHLSDEWI